MKREVAMNGALNKKKNKKNPHVIILGILQDNDISEKIRRLKYNVTSLMQWTVFILITYQIFF